jgi:hypothetical protein
MNTIWLNWIQSIVSAGLMFLAGHALLICRERVFDVQLRFVRIFDGLGRSTEHAADIMARRSRS